MKSVAEVSGINIQFPISRLILTGEKTVETRTYPIPEKYVGVPIAIVETPGKTGNFKARIIALAVFGKAFRYESKDSFYRDAKRHCVSSNSEWAWDAKKGKWGWPVTVIKAYKSPISIKKKIGIRFTNGLKLS